MQCLNHLLKLRHNRIKLSLPQKDLTSFSWIEPDQRCINRKNLDTQHRKCSVSSTNFNAYTCFIHLERHIENYKTLHRLVLTVKSSRKTIRRLTKGTISRLLLPKVTYYFCQQFEDHFNTAITTELNHIPFAAFFLCGQIGFQWY